MLLLKAARLATRQPHRQEPWWTRAVSCPLSSSGYGIIAV